MTFCTFFIANTMRSGIQFEARAKSGKQLFFYSPGHPELFAKWLGHGWQLLPIDRLPPAKRQKLMHLWKNRGVGR